MIGLAIEAVTDHVEILVRGADGEALAHEIEEVGHGHTRRLTPLVARALGEAGIRAADLAWVAADLGPGSFTGVRVGLATAEALGLASGARVIGASSLASLAHASGARRALVVPLVPAGRRDLYSGFFRADSRGGVRLMAAPRVGTPTALLEAVAEARPLLEGAPVRFIGPGAGRERELLEHAHPGSTSPEMRFEGLSATDLADAALSDAGPRAGLPPPGATPHPLYVRAAQAEERVRHKATAGDPIVLRLMRDQDLDTIAAMEREIFSDPWPASFFRSELAEPASRALVAEREGEIVGYSAAWLAEAGGHLGNLAVAPAWRRRGIARKLVERLLDDADALGCPEIALEVRVSNSAAQALYRSFGFRLAGLRRGYYRDTGEDALVMMCRPASVGAGSGKRSHVVEIPPTQT